MYFVDENSKALLILTKEKGVKVFDAPPDYAPAFIKSSKKVLAKFERRIPSSRRSSNPSASSPSRWSPSRVRRPS